MTDWLEVLDRIIRAQGRGELAMAREVSYSEIDRLTIAEIGDLLDTDPEWHHRYALAWVLGCNGEQGLPLLEQLATDEDDDVRTEARRWIEFVTPVPKQLKLL